MAKRRKNAFREITDVTYIKEMREIANNASFVLELQSRKIKSEADADFLILSLEAALNDAYVSKQAFEAWKYKQFD